MDEGGSVTRDEAGIVECLLDALNARIPCCIVYGNDWKSLKCAIYVDGPATPLFRLAAQCASSTPRTVNATWLASFAILALDNVYHVMPVGGCDPAGHEWVRFSALVARLPAEREYDCIFLLYQDPAGKMHALLESSSAHHHFFNTLKHAVNNVMLQEPYFNLPAFQTAVKDEEPADLVNLGQKRLKEDDTISCKIGMQQLEQALIELNEASQVF
jgi:hypothetical protein